MARQLVVIEGPDKGHVFPLDGQAPVEVGRGRQAGVRLADLHVSRDHCRIETQAGGPVLIDGGSTAGTFVNGRRVTEHVLQPGDVVRVGTTELRFQEDADDLADRPTLPPPSAPGRLAAAASPASLPLERLGGLLGRDLAHFAVEAVRARGQSGLVFRARDLRSGQDVALKVLWPPLMKDPEALQRFFRGTQTLCTLRHPHLVTVHEAGQTGPYCWVAMDFIDGESLTEVIHRIGVANMLDWRYAARVAVHIGRALQFAHGQSIIHRNLTPQNVLVRGSDKCALLGDLVLAKALEGAHSESITRPGEILGDVRYMSPERLSDTEPVDARSDIYSLGALVYALLTGRPPLAGSSLLETITLIRNAEPVPPRKYQMSIAGLFEGVVQKMLAKRPEDRFQSADELLAALDKVIKYHNVEV
jgi:pSer/pThr/pTyr-binding forkhead associated (FHA) protein